MSRINVYTVPSEYEPAELAGWFDPTTATMYEEGTRWDGHNKISIPTGSQWEHEGLYLTAGKRWVLNRWSQSPGRGETYAFVSAEYARDWLIRNEYETAALEAATGEEIPSERGPGQPQIGTQIKATIPDEHLAAIDEMVSQGEASSRSHAARILIARALA